MDVLPVTYATYLDLTLTSWALLVWQVNRPFIQLVNALISDQWPQSSFFLKNNDARSHHTMAMSGWDIQRNANLDGRK